jgi:hypothetical protein
MSSLRGVMVDRSGAILERSSSSTPSFRSAMIAVITIATAAVAFSVIIWFGFLGAGPSAYKLLPVTHGIYPVGITSALQPSGMAPPRADALKGYQLTYENNFLGLKLPSSWDVFTGVPGGDAGGQFAANHVLVRNGMLQLLTSRDSSYNMKWVTGGVCQCGLASTYGAYFVRSRVTGAGPNEVELLWPANNQWPPEIDFNETGGSLTSSSSTIHFGVINQIDQRSILINMDQWHTWGVIWTPLKISYVVDGQIWGTISTPSEIANIPMTLDLEQRSLCSVGRQCPSHRVLMDVDWVAEYHVK